MNKTFTSRLNQVLATLLLFTAMMTGHNAWAQSLSGSGTEADPYIISSSADWDIFANESNKSTYWSSNKYARLTADITITKTVGTSNYRYSGNFNGCGHTLTLNLTHTNGGDAFMAPFKYIYAATIRRLHTAGTITTNGKMCGGIIGDCNGTSRLQNCRSSVTISSSIDGDGTHGGLVGRVNSGTLTITNCLFDGSMLGANTTCCGGFVGWKESSLVLNNCLQAGYFTISSTDGATFCRYNSGSVDFSTCYYKATSAYGTTTQGTMTSAVGSDLKTLLGEGWEISDDNVFPLMHARDITTATIIGLNNEYIHTGSPIDISYTVTDDDGTVLSRGTDFTATLNGTDITNVASPTVTDPGSYTLVITGTGNASSGYYGSKSYSFKVMQILTGSGTQDDPHLINNADDWTIFASTINNGITYSGKFVKLTNDITVSTMVGSNDNKFQGTFNGTGHTLTFNYTNAPNYCAPFQYVNNATIKNLHVTGTISASSTAQSVAGFVGYTYGKCTIQNSWSSINIESSRNGDAKYAGFVGYNSSSSLNITNCLFDGSINSSNATYCAGFVGYQFSSSSYNCAFTNCLMVGTLQNNVTETSSTFSTNNNFSYTTLTNCYYKGSYGSATLQGDETSATGSVLQNLLGYAWEVIGENVVPIMVSNNLATATLSCPDRYPCLGSPIDIIYTVTDENGIVLTKGTDYTESFSPAIVQEIGDYTLTVTGIGNYTGNIIHDITVYGPDEVSTWAELMTKINIDNSYIKLVADVTDPDKTQSSYLYIKNKTVFLDLNGHTIDRGLTAPMDYGNVIRMEGGSLTIIDNSESKTGTITGANNGTNAGTCSNGGGIFMTSNATLTLSGGTITGNKSINSGSGVYVYSGDFHMTGGAITNNTTSGGNSSAGGGVYKGGGGTFYMTGGVISCNSALKGGGVYVANGTFNQTGGTINDNAATTEGGGVELNNNSAVFTMGGGTITNNIAPIGGGVLFNNGTFKISGAPTIIGNTISDSTTANNVYLPNGKLITIDSVLTNTTPISVTMATKGIFTSGLSGKGDPSNFVYDDSDYAIVEVSGEASVIYDQSGGIISWSALQKAFNKVTTDGTIVLTQDLTPDEGDSYLNVPSGQSFILDLNGFTLNRNLATATADGCVIRVNGGAITIIDSSNDKTGIITGGNNTGVGGGIHLNSGTLAMHGGSITGNNSSNNGGGVYITNGTFKLSGMPSITGNTKGTAANNVYLPSGKIITIDGILTNTTPIGITMASNDIFTSGLENNGTIDNFVADNDAYVVSLDGTEARLSEPILYNVTIADGIIGGIVTSDKTQPHQSEMVTLTLTPNDTYKLASVTVTETNTPANSVNVKCDGFPSSTAMFKMPAADVTVSATFTDIWTADGGLYVNLPLTGTTEVVIPDGMTSFKVYDDGGANGKYSPSGSGKLLLTAPEDCRIQLSGNIALNSGNTGLYIYDGISNSSTVLVHQSTNGGATDAIPTVISTGENMLICFWSNSSTSTYAGLDLLVTVVSTSTKYNVNVSNPGTGDIVEANPAVASAADLVTLTAIPRYGYVLDNISVVGASGNPTISGGTWYNNIATFRMPAEDVTVTPTFSDDLTNLSINIPGDGEKTGTIPAWVTSFKIYDNNGASGNYSSVCNGYLNLTVPAGQKLRLSGTIKTADAGADYLTIYDGSTTASTVLLDHKYSTTAGTAEEIGNIVSSGENMLLYFHSDAFNSSAGLDLTAKMGHTITLPDDLTGGIVSANLDFASDGETVTLTATPSSCYFLKALTYTYGDNEPIDITESKSFAMPAANVTINATFGLAEGIDIQESCDSYTWIDGITYVEDNNVATYAVVTEQGCDSIVTLNLTINYSENIIHDPVTVCNSYSWHGETYTESQTLTFDTVTEHGCPRHETLALTVNHANTGIDTKEACDSFTWIDGITYTESNYSATYTMENQYGCDSVVTLNLTVNKSYNNGNKYIFTCDSYTWNGTEYTESGDYEYHGQTAHGCDSTVVLHLHLDYSDHTGSETIESCDSYTWDNGTQQTYTQSGNYEFHTFTTKGCDSTVTLHLTINNSNTGIDNQVACDTYTWIDGNVYNESNNTATYTMTNAAGCDSVITLNLIVNEATYGTDVQTACNIYTWIDGIDYTEDNNSATFTLENQYGCDSIVTLNLTVFHTENVTLEPVTICDSYEFDGVTYTESQVITTERTDTNGCTYTETLNLTVNHAEDVTLEPITACDSYEYNGQTYTESQVFTSELTDGNGCSYTQTQVLTINHAEDVTLEPITTCDSYEFEGVTYTESQVITTERTDANGCTYTETLNLTINHAEDVTLEPVAACDSYEWNGMTYNESQTLTYTGTTSNGCDSIVTLELTINFSSEAYDLYAACHDEMPFTWNGVLFTEAGTQTATLQTVNGCDSTVIMTLEVWNPQISITGDLEIEQGEETTLTASGCEFYHWSTGETTPSITVAPTETTTYWVTGTIFTGCSAYAAVTVQVTEGTKEKESLVNVYPNPAKNAINIEAEGLRNIRLLDMTGQTLYETNASSNTVKIDLSGYAVGQYFLQVSTPNGVKTEKVVKK